MQGEDPLWYLEIIHLNENLITESNHLEGPFITQTDAEYRKGVILTKHEAIRDQLTINLIML
tara:strand:+ start:3227 stop:3412 length:186 start_codon:yes stop_codon:yes gene_type:complete